MTAPLSSRRLPELDFWRGIAIASVVLYHAIYWSQPSQPNKIADVFTRATVFGWLGVNLFFVLSGFLITGILLDSKGKPGYFRIFYGRRIRRIIPAYLVCLVLVVCFHLVSTGGLLRAVTFTANYNLIPAARSYGPLWSLSVEEQFYLVWPLVVLLVSRRALAAICVAICLLEPLVRYVAWVQGPGGIHDGLIHSGTLFIADSLALGALGAIYFRSPRASRAYATLISVILAVGACALFLVGYPHGLLHRTDLVGAALQVVPFNLVFAAAIFASVALRPPILGAAATRPIRFLGDISYGLYLYHLIVFAEYDRIFPTESYSGRFGALLLRAMICATVSIAIAWFSRWKFEEIFLRRKPKSVSELSEVAVPIAAVHPRFSAEEDASPIMISNASGKEL
jgi:peptidoglycan/LPS O-acetylase OafA/YrhL